MLADLVYAHRRDAALVATLQRDALAKHYEELRKMCISLVEELESERIRKNVEQNVQESEETGAYTLSVFVIFCWSDRYLRS